MKNRIRQCRRTRSNQISRVQRRDSIDKSILFPRETKLDLQKVAGEDGVQTPQNTPGKFPKIVKYADGYGSIGLEENSICYTDDEVSQRTDFLKSYNQRFGDVIIQVFIVGKECSKLVVEMGREVVGLTPIELVFPENTPPNQAFLTWDKEFNGVEDGIVKYAFLEDEPAQSHINAAAVQAFKALGVSGGGACAWVDLRLEQQTGDTYVLEVNCIPSFFYPQEEPECLDLVIQEKFPGAIPRSLICCWRPNGSNWAITLIRTTMSLAYMTVLRKSITRVAQAQNLPKHNSSLLLITTSRALFWILHVVLVVLGRFWMLMACRLRLLAWKPQKGCWNRPVSNSSIRNLFWPGPWKSS